MTVSATPAAEDHATAAARSASAAARPAYPSIPLPIADWLRRYGRAPEPAWLRASGSSPPSPAYRRLPVEGNRLYTPYVDLRAAPSLMAKFDPTVRTHSSPRSNRT